MKKKILIINGHPDKESYCTQLAEKYKKGAESSGADCILVNLIDLKFNPNLQFGYRQRTVLEPDLLIIQQDILDSDHLVFVYPTWWGTYPALLKGFIDRVFLPKFAFKPRENSLFWSKLLKGKSARLIVTMDTPKWYYSLFYKSPGHNSLKKNTLNFCGVKPVKITTISPVKNSKETQRLKWMDKIEILGCSQN
jgi:NAD(P)H dehydrogenase (quinone)